MNIKTETGLILKNKLLKGIKTVSDVVGSTLGPAGRNVIIDDETGTIRITKDGVTTAKSIKSLGDPIENIGAQLVKQASINSAEKAGDGTTTATILASAIIEEGIKVISQGVNPVEVKKGIDIAVTKIIENLKSISLSITSKDQLYNVAFVSSNNDDVIAKHIAKAMDKVGRDGLVSIEESKTEETTLDFVEGIQFNRGWKSLYFVTDNNKMQAVYQDPLILIYDGVIETQKQVLNLLQHVAVQKKPLVIIAKDIDREALAIMIINKSRGNMPLVAIKAPDFGERQQLILQDIAIMTGATVLSDQIHNLEKVNYSQGDIFGNARSIVVGKDDTTIIDGKGDIDKIKQRILELKEKIDGAKSSFEKEKLQDRLGKMVGGVAIIYVGAISEVELLEKKDRVDDALHATKAAIEEGILPGGGVGFIRAISQKMNSKFLSSNNNEKLGIEIVIKAVQQPFIKILENAGIDNPYEILSTVKNHENIWYGYNAKTNNYELFDGVGILDPLKVTRTALENAASIAGTILTTESVIFNESTEKKNTEKSEEIGY